MIQLIHSNFYTLHREEVKGKERLAVYFIVLVSVYNVFLKLLYLLLISNYQTKIRLQSAMI